MFEKHGFGIVVSIGLRMAVLETVATSGLGLVIAVPGVSGGVGDESSVTRGLPGDAGSDNRAVIAATDSTTAV